jgi:hypothetical protein
VTPEAETWSRLPLALRDHLIARLRDRNIGVNDVNQLRLRREMKLDV